MSSWTYAACSLIVPAWPYANGDPLRVRSKAKKSGLKSGFTLKTPRHWLIVLNPVFSEGFPLASRHGELNDGSVKPRVKLSFSLVALAAPPTFTLWLPEA